MTFEELHAYFKQKYKKKVHDLTTYDAEPCINYPEKKEIYIEVDYDVQIIIDQQNNKIDFWIQNNSDGEGCTISHNMSIGKIQRLVDVIMSKD